MKRFNPIIEMGWKPIAPDPFYKKQIRLIKESDFLCNIVEIGLDLLEEECSYENTIESKLKSQSSIESAFNLIHEEKQKFGYKYQIFNEEFMSKIKEKDALNLYMATMIYLVELRQIALYHDIISEGSPEIEDMKVILENIKDKHRKIMIDEFKSLEKSQQLTLTNILLQTFNYMLNVRIEFENNMK